MDLRVKTCRLGVTRRFVQNRTLSPLAVVDGPFTNEGMRKDVTPMADQGDFPFKTLFQNPL
jgi:hypothetical protein